MAQLLFYILVTLFLSAGPCLASGVPDTKISAICLNSLSVDNNLGVDCLRFTVTADKPGNFRPVIDIKKAMQRSLEYFFTALAIPDSDFWANLNPNGGALMIAPKLADTDLGKIILSVDLRLKGDMAELMSSANTEAGNKFWPRLLKKAYELGLSNNIQFDNKIRLIPGSVRVYEKEGYFHILESKLGVEFEAEYTRQGMEDKRQRELGDFAMKLMREFIGPHLIEKINHDNAYSDLRDIYNALILRRHLSALENSLSFYSLPQTRL